MKLPNKKALDRLRTEYPEGTRVELLKMDDNQAPPIGTKGTVLGVDDIGNLLMRWDNGCGLNVVFGEDSVRKLDSVTVICYGKSEHWDERADAAKYYLEAMAGCEGSEKERYTKIYLALISGEKICKDEVD